MNVRTVQKRETIYKNGTSPLYLRFTHERKRLEILEIEVNLDTLFGEKSKRINCTVADPYGSVPLVRNHSPEQYDSGIRIISNPQKRISVSGDIPVWQKLIPEYYSAVTSPRSFAPPVIHGLMVPVTFTPVRVRVTS